MLTEDDVFRIQCAIENLRAPERPEQTVQAGFSIAARLEAMLRRLLVGPVVPTGWKLVPVAPTPEMLKAANRLLRQQCDKEGLPPDVEVDASRAAAPYYRAMIEAAPDPYASQADANAAWLRHGSGESEWWSLGGFEARKVGGMWVLTLGGIEICRHEYLQVVMAFGERAAAAESGQVVCSVSDAADAWAPRRIWLQRGAGEEGTHTWCDHEVNEGHDEVAYVREDRKRDACDAQDEDEPAPVEHALLHWSMTQAREGCEVTDEKRAAFRAGYAAAKREPAWCEECGDAITAHDPGICGTCYHVKYRNASGNAKPDVLTAGKVTPELLTAVKKAFSMGMSVLQTLVPEQPGWPESSVLAAQRVAAEQLRAARTGQQVVGWCEPDTAALMLRALSEMQPLAKRCYALRLTGTDVQQVNRLIKQFAQMRKVMRQVGRGKMPDIGALMRSAR